MTKTQNDIIRFFNKHSDAAMIRSLIFAKVRIETGDFWEGETEVHRWINYKTFEALVSTGLFAKESIHNGWRYTLKETA